MATKRQFKTPLVSGYFDVKIYNASKPREQWLVKQDGDTITFNASLGTNTPEWVGDNIKSYTNKQGQQANMARVKIGSSCIFYNDKKQKIARPCNNDLNGRKYEAFIAGTDLGHNEQKASGLWANAIMIREVEVAAFGDDDNFDNATQYTPPTAAPIAQQPVQPTQPIQQQAADKLPF